MRRNVVVAASILLVFFVLLLSRLPAAWVHAQFASDIPLQDIQGSLWQGRASLAHNGLTVENISWQLQVMPLIQGKASLDFTIEDGAVRARGHALLSEDVLRVELPSANMDATILNRLGVLPYGTEIAGDVVVTDLLIEKQARLFSQAHGTLQWSPAYLVSPQAVSLQSYLVVLSEQEHQLVAHITDQGGPLAIDGLAYVVGDLTYRYTVNLQLSEQAPRSIQAGFARFGRADADGVVQVKGSGRLL